MAGLLTGCGGGGGDVGGGGGDETTEYQPEDSDYMVGPPGAILKLDDPDGAGYGVIVEIAPGQLEEYRTFYLTDDRFNVFRTPWLPTGFLAWPRRDEGAFSIKTAGDPPYEVVMTMTFPLPDPPLKEGEIFAAFYLDETGETDRWRFILPNRIDENTFTLVTTYRQTWNWGRVKVNTVDKQYLEAAMNERVGEEQTADIAAMLEEIQNGIANVNFSSSYCEALSILHAVSFETIKQEAYEALISSPIPSSCGSCDPVSPEFVADLREFIGKYLWLKFNEMAVGGAVEFGWRLYIIYLYLDLLDQDCNYICVQGAFEAGEMGRSFWIDCGRYHIMAGLQGMIEQVCPRYF
ncbi:hypothetical protein ACHHRT_10420 [Desulfurivibrio sp. D14AmB]|uniref:hypothetical protein n=1 Tax=Desulfurivibrio sp. D14AmB TaxID=3374370 RepID=UPI00376F2EAA